MPVTETAGEAPTRSGLQNSSSMASAATATACRGAIAMAQPRGQHVGITPRFKAWSCTVFGCQRLKLLYTRVSMEVTDVQGWALHTRPPAVVTRPSAQPHEVARHARSNYNGAIARPCLAICHCFIARSYCFIAQFPARSRISYTQVSACLMRTIWLRVLQQPC
jgi:hypothetical protein